MSLSDSKTPATGSSPAFTSYSLNYEDVILNRLFPTQESGFYVDVGAGHPQHENDLFALYNRGWSGINIEPNEHFFELHQQIRSRDRNFCMLLSDITGEPLTYYQIEGSGLSTCDENQAKEHAAHGHALQTRRVQVATLASVLSEAGVGKVDILKVDVEGFEEKVLVGNDWERFRPSVVLVEATYPESRERRPTSIGSFMEQRGYRHVLFDGLNDFYLEHSFQEPPGLSLPPNVFDHFVPAQLADLRRQVESLQNHFAAAERYALSLQANQDDVNQNAANHQAEYGRALTTAEALAAENCKLQQQLQSDSNEHKRLLAAAEALLAENRKLQQQLQSDSNEHKRLLAAAEALLAENRKLQQHLQSHSNENKRLRAASDQMRAEITGLNRMFDPLHATLEQAKHAGRGQVERIEHLGAELRNAHQSLQIVYASRSWKLTKLWRVTGRILRRSKG